MNISKHMSKRMSKHLSKRDRRGLGLTMVELLVGLGIVAILSALAVPSLRQFMLKQRLKSAASEFLSDVQLARSAATKLSATEVNNGWIRVFVGTIAETTDSCYVIAHVYSDDNRCNCAWNDVEACLNESGSSTDPETLKIVRFPSSSGLSVAPTSPSIVRMHEFSPATGMSRNIAANDFDLTSITSDKLRLKISPTGLARVCKPSGSNLSGFAAC